MIDWVAFLAVGVASLIAATVVVALFATALRLRASSDNGMLLRAKRVGAVACYVACVAAVLFGIYLIVPSLHGG